MRIVEVVPSLSEHSSGLTHAVTRLSEQLRQRGNDLTLAYAARTPLRSAPDWIRAFPQAPLLGRLGSSPAMRRWLARAAAAEPRPIIHSHSMWQMPVMYASWAAQRCRVPYVVSPHSALAASAMAQGSRMKPLMWACMQRRALEAATCFHACAASEAAEIRALGFRQPIAVIPHGIDLPAGPPAHAPRRAEVLFLGRLSQKKGIDTLLRAWHGLAGRFPAWQLMNRCLSLPSAPLRPGNGTQQLQRLLRMPVTRVLRCGRERTRAVARAERGVLCHPQDRVGD
jgi:glycosyltransferase involved in cell wall biosynthesis